VSRFFIRMDDDGEPILLAEDVSHDQEKPLLLDFDADDYETARKIFNVFNEGFTQGRETATECPVHGNAVHGKEAEELRAGIELILGDMPEDTEDLQAALQGLIDHTDARDSLVFTENLNLITGQKLFKLTSAIHAIAVNIDRQAGIQVHDVKKELWAVLGEHS
jgi:hypothetical protein